MAIGKYLEDEPLIDELEVKSHDGVVTLRDINFNAQVINDEFLELLPVKIVSISISKLDVHLSYKTLLTDSCRFVVEKLDFVLAPNEVYYKAKGSPSVVKKEGSAVDPETEPNRTKRPDPTSTEYTSQDEEKRKKKTERRRRRLVWLNKVIIALPHSFSFYDRYCYYLDLYYLGSTINRTLLLRLDLIFNFFLCYRNQTTSILSLKEAMLLIMVTSIMHELHSSCARYSILTMCTYYVHFACVECRF